MHTNRF